MFSYDQLGDFVLVALGLASAIVLIDKIVDIYRKYKEPALSVEEQLDEQNRKLQNDNRRILELEQSSKLQLRCLMQIMTHEIDGNHVEQLKETRDEVERFLINK